MSAPLVTYAVDGAVAHVELNRAEVSNALDLPTAEALGAAIDRAAGDAEVGVLLLTGAGPRFCAGGDVASFVAAGDQPTYLRELATVLDGVTQRVAAMPKPVVAGVQGAVAGAGLALMLSCDLIVAEASTRFVTAYAGIGLTPDCGLSYLLPRAVGQQRALELLLTGRRLTAEEALGWGLVSEVVDDGGGARRAAGLATVLAGGPQFALGQARALARSSWETPRSAVGLEEARVIAEAVGHPDAQARIAAFTSRR